MTNFQDRQYEIIYRMLWAGEVVPYKELLPSAEKRVDTAQSQLNNLIKEYSRPMQRGKHATKELAIPIKALGVEDE